MGICWYCYWGWSKPVADIYTRFVAVAGESAMHYGPAHIVWDDENFERECVQYCVDGFDADDAHWNDGRHTRDELEAVRQSLFALLALPDAELAPMPEDYDDEHPADYPPAVEMVVKP